MKNERCEWRSSVYEKKERSRQAAKLQRERKRAREYLQRLREKDHPGYSLFQLLDVVIINYTSPLVCQMAIDEIRLKEKNLSASDRAHLDQIEAQLTERRDCSRQVSKT